MFPSVACTTPASGTPPSLGYPANMCSVVKVCAGKLFAVAPQSARRVTVIFQRLSLLNPDQFEERMVSFRKLSRGIHCDPYWQPIAAHYATRPPGTSTSLF